MKKFIVAAFCTLMMSGSVFAQEAATIVAPVAPVEDVAQEAAPVAPVAEGTFQVAPQVVGCTGCGATSAPMTYTQAPAAGCSSCGSAAPMTYTQAPASGCGCSAPAPTCGCAAPAPTCCAPEPTCCDPCANQGRQGFLAKRRARRSARRSSSTCCY